MLLKLYYLVKKVVTFKWGEEQTSALKDIKLDFKQAKLLRFFNPRLQTALETVRTYKKAYKDAKEICGGLSDGGGIHRLGSGNEGDKRECYR